jgi:Sulfotransferase domain
MIVLCNGMPRSASTWSFNVCRLLLHELRPDATLCGRYHENIAEVIDPLRGSYDHVVLKCHFLDERGRELCRSGVARTVYTHRDPFDAIYSAMVMFQHSFEDALDSVRRSLELFEFHCANGNAHIVDYHAIVRTPKKAIAMLAAYLDLNASPEGVKRIAAETSIDAMKAIAGQVGRERQGVCTPRSVYDPETQVHRDHIRDGRTGHGRKLLSPDQLRRADEVLAPFLERAASRA